MQEKRGWDKFLSTREAVFKSGAVPWVDLGKVNLVFVVAEDRVPGPAS